MSPEVLLNAGVPCCRLVQNAGEFVVTFPRAYHSGFSHGFNCGEAANIATPEWLTVAKEAAIRRAAINCPPMVSHFQLLYDLALSLCSRVPKSIAMEPRSSRLKDRKRGEGDKLIKELFFQDMKQNNDMLNILGKGSSIVLLPHNSTHSFRSNPMAGVQSTNKSKLFPSLCSPDLELKNACYNVSDEFAPDRDRKQGLKQAKGSVGKRTFSSLFGIDIPTPAHTGETHTEIKKASQCEQGLFSCVTCGILCFACVAIVQPREETAQFLMSADCSILNSLEESDNDPTHIFNAMGSITNLSSALVLRSQNGLSADQVQYVDRGNVGLDSDSKVYKEPSSLGLLALAYGDSSDAEEEDSEASLPAESCGTSKSDDIRNEDANGNTEPKINCRMEISLQTSDSSAKFGPALPASKDGEALNSDFSDECNKNSSTMTKSNSLTHRFSRHQTESQLDIPNSLSRKAVGTFITGLAPREPATLPSSSRLDEDSSRLHVLCLQHAMQVGRRLSQVGGADVLLVCHPDYPKLESHAKKVAEELESNHIWAEVSFREATDEDEEIIRRALESENAIHDNGDWAVKLGINLFYSANLSRSPLYSKQMHYNFVVYNAFGCSSPTDSSLSEGEREGRCLGRQKKITVVGKWCGKVWMSNQAHPLLVKKDSQEHKQELAIASWTKPDLKYVRRTKRRPATGILPPVYKTSKKKRNNAGSSRPFMKEETLEAEKLDKSRDFSVRNCNNQTKRKRGSRITKEENPESQNLGESSDESPLSDSCKQIESRHKIKRVKKENLESEEDSSEECLLSKSWKQIKNKQRAKQRKKETADIVINQNKNKNLQLNILIGEEMEGGPSTRLRRRTKKPSNDSGARSARPKKPVVKTQQRVTKAMRKSSTGKVPAGSSTGKSRDEEAEYACDMEGCTMSFCSKQELTLHKRNICPVKGCGKKFFSHKYLVQHRRVHMEDRPLKCPWKGCKMTFKWAWARTEHIRVHTGARPYVCTEAGCGQTFRFVSDFSRHKRKTGHAPKKVRG